MVLNAASSTVGQVVLQLCKVLQLRCIALVRDHGKHEQTANWLQVIPPPSYMRSAERTVVLLDKQYASRAPHLAIDSSDSHADRLAQLLATT